MNRLGIVSIAALAAAAIPAAAQNSSAVPPPTASAPPPKAETPPPSTGTPPAATAPAETVEPAAPAPVVVQPVQTAPPVQPVTISPDAAYPNGFADPDDPFANEMRAYSEQQSGFDWGLLGLLGLLGLIPLIRGTGRVRTVYVERDDEPRRVVRRERIEEE